MIPQTRWLSEAKESGPHPVPLETLPLNCPETNVVCRTFFFLLFWIHMMHISICRYGGFVWLRCLLIPGTGVSRFNNSIPSVLLQRITKMVTSTSPAKNSACDQASIVPQGSVSDKGEILFTLLMVACGEGSCGSVSSR